MNILFFLKPKIEVAYVYSDCSVRKALDIIRQHGYTAIPVIDRDGMYQGTVTEGDFLRLILNHEGDRKELESLPLRKLPRKVYNQPVRVSATLRDLFLLATNQNFVPVLDDRGVFIGIVTRKDILTQYIKELLPESAQNME